MSEGLDREVDIRRIGLLGAGLAALVVLAAVAMWFLIVGLRAAETAADPPPPLLPEARAPAVPPGPRLQTDPAAEMAALDAAERESLEGWAWVDREAGIARVPIQVGMDLLLATTPGRTGQAAPTSGEGQP